MSSPTFTWLKFPEENPRFFGFDFAAQPEIAAGATLASAGAVEITRISGSGTLTATAVAITGTKVQARFSGGSQGDTFSVLFTVTTSAGDVLAARGILYIDRPIA